MLEKNVSRGLTNGPTIILRLFLASREFFMFIRKKMSLRLFLASRQFFMFVRKKFFLKT